MKWFEIKDRYLQLVRACSIVVLLTLTAHVAALLTWQFLGSSADFNMAGGGKQPVRARPDAGRKIIPVPGGNASPGFQLFGSAEKKVVQTPVKENETSATAPKTTLQLELKGVIAFKPDAKALAIISEKGKNKEDMVYGIGDQVPGNAEIRGIYPDRVILSRAGKYETLMMTEDTDSTPSPSKNSQEGRKREERRSDANVRNMGDGKNWQIDKSYWQEKISDIPGLAKEVGVEVYKEGGKQTGFRLTSNSGGKLLTELGLKAGDVIYEVNGIKLTNASQGLTAYNKIKNAPQVNVVVGRNGQGKETVSYSVR